MQGETVLSLSINIIDMLSGSLIFIISRLSQSMKNAHEALDLITGIKATDNLLTPTGITGLMALLKSFPSITEVGAYFS